MLRSCLRLPVLVLLTAVLCAGCSGPPACQQDDFACYAQNMSLFEVDRQTYDEVPVTLTDLPAAAIESLLPPEGSSATDLPRFTGGYSLSLSQEWKVYPDEEDLIELEWEDPTGAVVGGCWRPCPRKMICAVGFKCSDPRRDGKTSGTSLYGIVYHAQPAQDSQPLDLQVVPIASSSGDAVPLLGNWVSQGSPAGSRPPVLVGPQVVVQQVVRKQKQSPDSGGPTGCTKAGDPCTSGPTCVSGRSCIVNVMSSGCECGGSVSGQCAPSGYAACSSSGAVCGDGQHACCAGLQCTNGTCEGPGGRCPLQ